MPEAWMGGGPVAFAPDSESDPDNFPYPAADPPIAVLLSWRFRAIIHCEQY
jgi:hypothetical protein